MGPPWGAVGHPWGTLEQLRGYGAALGGSGGTLGGSWAPLGGTGAAQVYVAALWGAQRPCGAAPRPPRPPQSPSPPRLTAPPALRMRQRCPPPPPPSPSPGRSHGGAGLGEETAHCARALCAGPAPPARGAPGGSGRAVTWGAAWRRAEPDGAGAARAGAMVTEEQVAAVGRTLLDAAQPLPARFRALFTLRGLGGPEAVACIGRAFGDGSELLKHELAYCLGQMRDEAAIPVLLAVLRDARQEPMVRHEAGEALGAIGNPAVLDVLKQYSEDPVVEVAETCQLAVKRLEWLQEHGEEPSSSPYQSVDPAPPAEERDVAKLREALLDEARPLFDRYRAMFALRNLGGRDAVLALADERVQPVTGGGFVGLSWWFLVPGTCFVRAGRAPGRQRPVPPRDRLRAGPDAGRGLRAAADGRAAQPHREPHGEARVRRGPGRHRPPLLPGDPARLRPGRGAGGAGELRGGAGHVRVRERLPVPVRRRALQAAGLSPAGRAASFPRARFPDGLRGHGSVPSRRRRNWVCCLAPIQLLSASKSRLSCCLPPRFFRLPLPLVWGLAAGGLSLRVAAHRGGSGRAGSAFPT
uniref:deoxyhypusine monooxygenase n=1 Tax=Cairina moschata TaxID=8855 RepID=A0A8C3CJE2_CAIMO